MIVENEPFPFVVTNVEADGPFLRIWAQTDEKIVQSVGTQLRNLQPKLDYNVAPLGPSFSPSSFRPNTHCCARRSNSSDFCRAKVLGVRSDAMLKLHFVDYGVVSHVPLNSVRLLDGIPEANYLFSMPDAAIPFILADVMPIGNHWMDNVVATIRSILLGNRFLGLFQLVNNYKALKFQVHNEDFARLLIKKNMALYNAFNQQTVQAPILPQPVRVHCQTNSMVQDNWRSPVTQNTAASVAAVKAIQLEINSVHDVRVSYVEEGPRKFSVQLHKCIPYLNAMMDKINSQSHLPLQEPPIAGAVCLGRQTQTNKLCRVVLNSPGDTTCKVYFADYGHHEVLPFTSIYQIPHEFVVPNVFSIRFTLSGILNWTITDEMKSFFANLVGSENLKLKVCKGPMSPLTQYCDLYVNGKNVKDILLENFSDHCVLAYCEPRRLQKGSTENVFVSHVISPAKFFVQLDDDLKNLDQVSDQIDQIAQTAEVLKASQLYKGMPCIALYGVDKKWYRASVVDLLANSGIKVFYIDFGNEEVVSINNLRVIPRHLVKILPKQAIACGLYGISSETLDPERVRNFKALVLEERLSLTIQDILPDIILVHLNDRKNMPTTSGKSITERLNDFKAAVEQDATHCVDKSTKNGRDVASTQFKNDNDPSSETKNSANCESVKSKCRKDSENEQRHDNRFRKGAGNDYANGPPSNRFDKEASNRDPEVNDRFNKVAASDKTGSDKDSDTSSRSSGRRNARQQKRNVDEPRKRPTTDKQPNNRQRLGRWENEEQADRRQNLNNDGNVSIADVKSPNHETSKISRYFTSTSISQIPPPNITVGAVKHCELVYYTNPSNFYVQLCPDNQELHAMSDKIQGIYGIRGKALEASEIKKNLQCVARYSKDKLWYRAVVINVESSVATVHFVDYGNVEAVRFDEIKEIEAEFIKLPAQAVQCKLFCPSKSSSWSQEESDALSNELYDKILEAEFVKEENGFYEILIKDAKSSNQQSTKYINDLFSNSHDSRLEGDAKLCGLGNPETDQRLILPHYTALNEKWLENPISLGNNYNVLLAWFINPEHFYCQLASQQDEFRNMMNEIQTFYEKAHPVSHSLEVGSSVIAILPDDGVLYRAEVMELNKPRGHVVQYVDYGDRAMVSPRKIYPVDRKFRSLPKQAIFCGLKNISPPSGSDWTNSEEITKFFVSEKFDCIFHEVKQDRYLISLIANGSDVASALVNKNLAVFSSAPTSEIISDVSEDTGEKQHLPRIDVNLLEGQTLLVRVSNVEGVSKFYVQFYTAEACQSIVDYYMAENDPRVMPRLLSHEICIGAGCLVCHNGKWKRCVVINCNKPNYEVRFIDTGEHETFTLNNMLGLPGQLAVMQYQATECALFDVPLSSKANDLLKKTITGSHVKIFVEKVECNRLIVRLFDLNGNKIKVVDSQNTEKINPVCSMQILSSTHDVIVTCIKNSKSVWLQRTAEVSTEQRLLNAIYDHYSKVDGDEQAKIITIEENELYAALSFDKNWYRVKVTRLNETARLATVILIDYGNAEDIPFDNLRPLARQFYLPHQLAVEVSLTAKIDGSDEEQQKILESLFSTKVHSATFYNVNRKWVAELSDAGQKISDKLASLNLVEQGSKVSQHSKLAKQSPEMRVGERYKAFVSHIDNPGQLWLQRDEEVDALVELQKQLQEVAAAAAAPEESASDSPPLVLEEKTICLALYTFDNSWYRAEVLDMDSEIVTVRFVDYGNSDTVDNKPSRVIPLPDKWKAVQRYATRCKLDVLPANGESDWSEEACKKVADLVDSTQEVLIIADKAPMRVDLFLSDGRSVCRTLIETRLAEPAVSSESPSGTLAAEAGERQGKTGGGDVDDGVMEDAEDEVQLDPRSAFVSTIESVDNFYVQEEKSVNDLEMMEDRLMMAEMFSPLADVEVGQMCVAKYSLDGSYYRAIVLSHGKEGTRVCFLDYGNVALADDLRLIPDDLTGLRPLARRCRLAKPDGVEHWPADVNEEFIRLAGYGERIFLLDVLEEEEEPCLVRLTVDSKDFALELLEECESARPAGNAAEAAVGQEDGKDSPPACPVPVVEVTLHREERPSPIGQENTIDNEAYVVTHANSPSDFWIQNAKSRQLSVIAESMANAANFEAALEIGEGKILAAKFHEDDLWYRSKVLSNGEGGAEVFYMDYGCSAFTESHANLRELPPDLARLPPLATRCSLKIPENLDSWPEAACEKFTRLCDDKTEFRLRTLSASGRPDFDCPMLVALFAGSQDVVETLLSAGAPAGAMERINRVDRSSRDSRDRNTPVDDNAFHSDAEQHGPIADNSSNTSPNGASAAGNPSLTEDSGDENAMGDGAIGMESEQSRRINNPDGSSPKTTKCTKTAISITEGQTTIESHGIAIGFTKAAEHEKKDEMSIESNFDKGIANDTATSILDVGLSTICNGKSSSSTCAYGPAEKVFDENKSEIGKAAHFEGETNENIPQIMETRNEK